MIGYTILQHFQKCHKAFLPSGDTWRDYLSAPHSSLALLEGEQTGTISSMTSYDDGSGLNL
jgi:hypothetical protein